MVVTMMPQMTFATTKTSTHAKKSSSSITVYLTVSNDGDFVKGTDGTVMARVPITISYFDLADYELQDYYRYQADTFENGGAYIGSTVIEQPTVLHLFIKALEQYYAGHKLSSSDVHSNILDVTGSATHLYMKHFWGHDENLMYFVDHAYPLQAKGWGSTCDYILLHDGMEIDVAMFTDWNFYKSGAFATFDKTSLNANTGSSVTLTMLATATNADSSGNTSFVGVPMAGETVRVSNDYGKTWTNNYATTDSNGKVSLTFNNAGVYYVAGGPSFKNYSNAAPPISVITVTGNNSGGGTGGSNSGSTTPTDSGSTSTTVCTPEKTNAILTSYNSVRVSWSEIKNAAKYRVYYRKAGANDWSKIDTTDTKVEFSDLIPGTLYKYKVSAIAIDASGNTVQSDCSTVQSVQTIKGPTVRAKRSSKNNMTLKWKAIAGADGYRIIYKTDNGKWKHKDIKKTSWSRSGLKTGHLYQYKVMSYVIVNKSKLLSGYSKTIKCKF